MESFTFAGPIAGRLCNITVVRCGEVFIVYENNDIVIHLRKVAGECLVHGPRRDALTSLEFEFLCSEIKAQICLLK